MALAWIRKAACWGMMGALAAACVSAPPPAEPTAEFLSQKEAELAALPDNQLRLASYNVRLYLPTEWAHLWKNRVDGFVENLYTINPHAFGVQEAFHCQVEDILKRMPDYDFVGIGRGGGERDEYSAVFYHKKLLSLLDSGTFWYSETPDRFSMGWDAACPRICTWAKFKLNATGKEFYLYNSHWDHVGKQARFNSSEMLARIAGGKTIPVFLSGDFNATPNTDIIHHLMEAGDFSDPFSELKLPLTESGTFHDFTGCAGTARLDYLFHNRQAVPLQYGRLTQANAGAHRRQYASDHFPIWALFRLK